MSERKIKNATDWLTPNRCWRWRVDDVSCIMNSLEARCTVPILVSRSVKRFDEIAGRERDWTAGKSDVSTGRNHFLIDSFLNRFPDLYSERLVTRWTRACARCFTNDHACRFGVIAIGHYFIDGKLLFQRVQWRTTNRMQMYAVGHNSSCILLVNFGFSLTHWALHSKLIWTPFAEGRLSLA